MPFLANIFYPGAAGVVAASEGMADDIANVFRIPRDQIQVIYNPAITRDLFTSAAESIPHPWFTPGAPPVVLGVGRLTRAKNFLLLIHAFSQLRSRCPARLVILGEGEERPALEAKARELGVEMDVDLPGFVSNPYPYMRQATVFVLSSAWEGLPNALIQALALGTPVVSTDCPSGPREILKGGALGELIPVGNPDAMRAAIEAVLGGKRSSVLDSDLDRFRCEAVTQEYLDLILGGAKGS
jgi:glycosyltransferase involved in cell wall biosynthesis